MTDTANLTIQLTPRDVQIILMVYDYDGIPNFLIRQRFWPQNAASRHAVRRVSQLISAGYLRAKPLPSLTGKGSGPLLLTIGPASHPFLRQELGLTSAELKRLRHSYVPMLWAHDGAVRTFRLSLETAGERSALVTGGDWTNEAELRRTPFKVALAQQTVELVPDGLFTLTLADGRTKTFYLELDRATELSPARFRWKLLAYFAHVGQAMSPVLLVVPTEARRQQLTSWITSTAAELKQQPALFALALSHDITEQTILDAPIWQVLGGAPMRLLPEPVTLSVTQAPRSPATWYDQLLERAAS